MIWKFFEFYGYLCVIIESRHALVSDSHFEAGPSNGVTFYVDHVTVQMSDSRRKAGERILQRNGQIRVEIIPDSFEKFVLHQPRQILLYSAEIFVLDVTPHHNFC